MGWLECKAVAQVSGTKLFGSVTEKIIVSLAVNGYLFQTRKGNQAVKIEIRCHFSMLCPGCSGLLTTFFPYDH